MPPADAAKLLCCRDFSPPAAWPAGCKRSWACRPLRERRSAESSEYHARPRRHTPARVAANTGRCGLPAGGYAVCRPARDQHRAARYGQWVCRIAAIRVPDAAAYNGRWKRSRVGGRQRECGRQYATKRSNGHCPCRNIARAWSSCQFGRRLRPDSWHEIESVAYRVGEFECRGHKRHRR
jgi:hypothetical protein